MLWCLERSKTDVSIKEIIAKVSIELKYKICEHLWYYSFCFKILGTH